MEVSFYREIESLKLGAGQVFHGEGILAVTKALLQSGVTYVGGYQGSPVSHLLDVMVQARPYLDELGVHVEACTNESSAAAMLAASMVYPVRGAVTWKSIVGTNVASDALSNIAFLLAGLWGLREARRRGAEWMYISATPSENTIGFYLRLGCRVALEPDPELFELEPEDIHLEYLIGNDSSSTSTARPAA